MPTPMPDTGGSAIVLPVLWYRRAKKLGDSGEKKIVRSLFLH